MESPRHTTGCSAVKKAIAIWNYCWNAAELPRWIEGFAESGFNAISFHPDQFAAVPERHLSEVVDLLRSLELASLVHGNVAMDPQLMERMVDAMGDTLKVFSMDSAMRQESRGVLHDAERIQAALSRLRDLTQGTDVRMAIEDFPLDLPALDFFSSELGEIYLDPRAGVLVDVGHMHMRMTGSDYFAGLSVQEYFERLPVPLVEIHLHDNNGLKDQHGHLGYGTLSVADVAIALKAIEFSGISTIEVAPSLHGRTPDHSRDDAVQSLKLWDSLMRG